MRARLYHLLRDTFGEVTTVTGYGDWRNTKHWDHLKEILMKRLGLFDFSSGRHPQGQVKKFIEQTTDDQFEEVLIAIPMAAPHRGIGDQTSLTNLEHYNGILDAIGIPVRIDGTFRYGKLERLEVEGEEEKDRAQDGSPKYRFGAPFPKTLKEVRQELDYWASQEGERGHAGSIREERVLRRIEHLERLERRYKDTEEENAAGAKQSVSDLTHWDRTFRWLKSYWIIVVIGVVALFVIFVSDFLQAVDDLWRRLW